jgi:tryptophan 2,3-dioxygenase
MAENVPTYWDYLKVDQLLDLQGGLDNDETQLMPDELHFILVHQTLELWFKLILSELRLARDHLAAPEVPEEHIPHVVHHLGRIIEILKLGASQFDVVETLTSRDFLGFRDKLSPASGFQSFQLREIEILMGLEESQRVRLGKVTAMDYLRGLAKRSTGGANAWSHIQQARSETTLLTALGQWLHRTPIQGSHPADAGDDRAVDAFLTEYLDAYQQANDEQLEKMIAIGAAPEAGLRARFDATRAGAHAFLGAEDMPLSQRPYTRRIRAAILFVECYRELPLLAWPRRLLDTVAELEERVVLFRHRHARMVERVIGRRVGTGGSSGVDYLDKTAQYRVFQDLWSVRTLLLKRESLPPLRNPDFYGFAS